MKILIVGGGIGGLATAGFLEQKGFEVTLIERAPQFGHIGFGLSIWEEGYALLKKLGVSEEIKNKGYALPWYEMRGRHGHLVEFRNFKIPTEPPPLMIERSVLLDAMVKNLRTTKLFLETTIKELRNGKNAVWVELSNGIEETYDLLIAADGINSEIRDRIFGTGKSNFYDWSARSFWIPDHLLSTKGATVVSIEKIGFGIFPLKDKHFIVMYEYNPERVKRSLPAIDDFLPIFGWDKELAREITKESREDREYYGPLSYVPLGDWYSQRIILIGDAAHGFSPVAGMGANMAIEDGYVLAEELAKGDPDSALKNFAKRRNSRLKSIISTNRFLDKVFFIRSAFFVSIRDILAWLFPIQRIRKVVKKMRNNAI